MKPLSDDDYNLIYDVIKDLSPESRKRILTHMLSVRLGKLDDKEEAIIKKLEDITGPGDIFRFVFDQVIREVPLLADKPSRIYKVGESPLTIDETMEDEFEDSIKKYES